MIVKPLGVEVDLTSEETSVDNATLVRVVNTTSSAKTVEVSDVSGVVASVTLSANESLHIQKYSTETISCTSAGVKVGKVAFAN